MWCLLDAVVGGCKPKPQVGDRKTPEACWPGILELEDVKVNERLSLENKVDSIEDNIFTQVPGL